MDTRPISPEMLAASVVSVPPLARNADLSLNVAENTRIIRHLEAGGVTTLLYGGNAVLSHVALSDYAALLTMLRDAAGPQSLVVPSVGPAYGMMLDQARILRDFEFPTAMLLPTRDAFTPNGLATGMRKFVESYGKPAVLYLKYDGTIDVDNVQRLMKDGLISWIKYAIVRKNPSDDVYLRSLIDAIGPSRIVSGMGEQPAIVHLRDFGLIGFTSGCVCVAPKLSDNLLKAVQAKDYAKAELIRSQFKPLEDLRDSINPVRVLHAAVQLAGVAETGPILPLLSPIEGPELSTIAAAAKQLRALPA